ncbi:ATP-binding cassette, sub-family B, member 6 [Jimgerdemannia flammicorona]|uniref:ATP-binding cassette, sub-family B, member 6 n=1 Tax=Jimgerdemannia flammicorona TaxID=994334 RepID=A0A433PQ20_9FUNG|nr:ATP-binding cassette, sub-family B, member 6 [Jimgerdemannia flammicorona]
MDRGTNSIIQLLSQIFFQIVPTLVDIVIAVLYFIIAFGWSFGTIVLTTMVLYIYITVAITEWRTSFRREMIELDNDARAKAVDSLLNFETVKYYNAEEFEVRRYARAIESFQVADFKSSSSLNVLNLSQNAVITAGLLVGCLLCAYKVVNGKLSVGDFVLFLTYILQLYQPVRETITFVLPLVLGYESRRCLDSPTSIPFYHHQLNFFGTYYRMIQSNFVDMEKMLALFKYDQTVKDASDAKELVVSHGAVTFGE